MIFQLPLIPENNGQNVLQLLDTSEIKLIVDHAGLMEPLKLSMIEFVLNQEENKLPYYPLLILLDVVDSYHASQWDVMEDKLDLHGHGSKILELYLEEILDQKIHAILTQCHSVTIMLMIKNIQIVLLSNKYLQLVLKNVKILKIINLTKSMPLVLILWDLLKPSKKI